VGVSRDCPFFWIPTIISRTRKAMASIFTGPSEQKPIKNFGKKGAWAYPGTAPIVWVPPIISGTGKATIFKFCGIFMASEEKPIKNCRKSCRGHSQVVRKIFKANFQGTHWAHCTVIFAIAQLPCPVSLRVSEILPVLFSSTPLFPPHL